MPYTTPHTIAAGELVTVATMNNEWGGNVSYLANPPACRVYHNAAQGTTTGVSVALAFNSERYDTNTMHDTVTANTRVTIKTAGVYVFTATVSFANNGTGFRQVGLLLNGVAYIALVHCPAIVGDQTHVSIPTTYKLAVNDYIEVMAQQTSGGNLNVNSNANYSPEFSATWVGLG